MDADLVRSRSEAVFDAAFKAADRRTLLSTEQCDRIAKHVQQVFSDEMTKELKK